MRERLLGLAALDELKVLRAVRRIQEGLVVWQRRLRAHFFDLHPVTIEDCLAHALELRSLGALLGELDVRFVLNGHEARRVALLLQVLQDHADDVLLDLRVRRVDGPLLSDPLWPHADVF